MYYAIHKGIRLSLRRLEGSACPAIFEIFSALDCKFSKILPGIHRHLLCKPCIVKGKYGSFPMTEGLRLLTPDGLCSPDLEHNMDKNLVGMMHRVNEPEPFQLESLMQMN